MNKIILSFFAVLISIGLHAQNWSWTATNGPFGASVNDIVVTGNGTFLASAQSGMFRSTDNGTTWSRVTVVNQNSSFLDLEVAGSGTVYLINSFINPGSNGFYSSTDNGVSWALLAGSGLVGGNPKKIKAAPNGKLYLVYTNQTVVYRSSDGGATFSQLPVTFSSNVTDIDVDASSRLIVSTASSGVVVSSNDGINFSAVGTGLSASAVISATAVDASGNIYTMASDGPYRSLDHGATWSSTKGALTDVNYFGYLETDPSNNLYLVNQSTNKIYSLASPSTSTSWSAGAPLNVSNPNSLTAVNFQSPTAWYLGRSNTGIEKSVDAGVSYTNISNGMKGLNPFPGPKLMITSGGRIFYSIGALGYQLSIDNGSTWNLISSGTANRNISGFLRLSDASILAFGFGGIIRTTDQGNNWTVQSSTATTNLFTGNGNNIYYYSTGGTTINKSVDKGVTFSPLTLTGLPALYTISKIIADTGDNLYIYLNNNSNSTVELWKVASPGTSAVKLTSYPGAGISDLTTVGTNLYVIYTTNFYKSTDGGSTFATSSIPSSSVSIWGIDNSNLYAQGAAAGVFYSTSDGGASWSTKTLVDNALARVTDIALTSSQFLIAATTNSMLQKSSTPVILPLAPTNLSIAAKGVQNVDLQWTDNATNETGYQIEFSAGNNSSYQVAVTYNGAFSSPQNKLYASNPVPTDSLVTYYYRVKAVNAAGSSPYSNEVSGVSLKSCASTIPTNRSWTAVAVADPGSTASGAGPFQNSNVLITKTSKNSFTVSQYDLGVCPPAIRSGVTSAFFMETCGQTYFQNDLSGQDFANGQGTWNGTNTITLKWQADPSSYNLFQGTTTFTLNANDPAPSTPTLTTFIFSGTINLLLWTQSPFATQYVIERSTVSNTFSGPPIATVNYPTVQYADTGVTPGTLYYYRVTAKNATGSSAPSAQSSITPPVSTLFSPVQNSLALNTDNQQGVSWGDLDGDGDEDYIIPSFNTVDGQLTVPVFYENKGAGQFSRRTIDVLTGENTSTYRGAIVMDANNDGKLDVYFTRSSSNTLPDLLLTNNGGWVFTKNPISASARASGFRAAAAADYDHDGLLDITLIDSDPSSTAVSPIFMKNQSSANTISFSALNNAITSSATIGREVSWADFNNDGFQDLLILFFNSNSLFPNPNVPNKLFKNNGDGTFTQVTGTVFDTDIFFGARTSSWGDIDNDGDLDLYIGSQTSSGVADRLYQNNGNGTFTSITGGVVAETGTQTFGSAFGDIDNDGDLDLISINNVGGNSIFINSGSGTFTKYLAGSELLNSSSLNNIGGSFVDYDNNGFLDISTGRNSGNIPPFLYQNTLTASASRNWVEFKLIGTLSNKAAIGARISVTTTSPARTMIREITSRSGYGSQASLIQHFGLGSATNISQIKITWPNGGVQTWTNPPAGQTINQIVTITEDFAGPTFTFTPANGATGVALGNSLVLNLNKAGTAVIGKNIVVRKGSPTAVPTQTLAANSGIASSGNTVYTYTLAASFDPLTQYYISIDAGAFVDIFANTSLAVPPSAWSFITIDNVAPTISFTPPALIDKSKIATTVFNVTAADNISVSSVVMSYKGLAATTYQTTSGALNAGTGKYDFTLQSAYFDATGMEYYFTVTDGSGNTANSPASGTHVTHIDNIAPTITFTAPSNVQKSSISTTTLSLSASDNFSVVSVVMSYRKVTATQYQTLTGVFNAATSKYDFPLQGTFFDDMGMEYFFTAKDGSDNAALNPASGTNVLKVAFSATTTALGVSAGSAVADYKIISIPLDLASSNFANILSNFGAPDPTVWKLLKYQQTPQAWVSYPNGFTSAARGEGYFILSKQGQNLNFDQAVAPSYSQTNLFQLSLSPGFNLIGNPYMLPINWEDSRIAGVGAVKMYQGGNYTDGNSIEVYSGGFVFANAAVTVPVKLKTSVNGGRMAQPVSSRIDGDEWIVPIRMIQEDRQFNFGGIGMSPRANLSYDDLDDFAPPSPTGQFEMNFAHPEHFMKNFSRDVVPAAQGHTWSFNAASNLSSPTRLEWNNTEFAGVGPELYLLDVAMQRPVNMKTETSYEFSPTISKEFKVFYGSDVKDQLKPNHVFLGSVSPNPASGPVSIPFTLPDAGGPMNVNLQVFDMLGRPVESILNQVLPSGFYRVDYDASSAPGGNGMYIIKLAVSYQGTQEVATTKLIIRK